jgi:hypothetical protein
MDPIRVQLRRRQRADRHAGPDRGLTTCSLCLRVLRSSAWVEAERVIREIRSFELEAPPRLMLGVCDSARSRSSAEGAGPSGGGGLRVLGRAAAVDQPSLWERPAEEKRL